MKTFTLSCILVQGLTSALAHHGRKKPTINFSSYSCLCGNGLVTQLCLFAWRVAPRVMYLYYEEKSISVTKTKKCINTETHTHTHTHTHISLKESQVQHHHKTPRDHQIHQRCMYTPSLQEFLSLQNTKALVLGCILALPQHSSAVAGSYQ